jgi:WD40 repeat protein
VVKGLPAEWGMCSRTVSLDNDPTGPSYWNNTIAVGSLVKTSSSLMQSQAARWLFFLGTLDWVRSLTFSSDGTSLVSGSDDRTVKLWDVQTGGVVKTFHGHTNLGSLCFHLSRHTRIASGSRDGTIRLWDIQTGECFVS